ncbi:MAG: glycosyltransferase [Verrucomicrobiota bacterium]
MISIGILAWNEEASIGATLHSLFEQSLLTQSSESKIEVIVVANGCSDQTADVARDTFAQQKKSDWVSGSVLELSEPGKINAWNCFIHEESSLDTDIFILLDADIKLLGESTLLNMVQVLRENPDVLVATDEPIKHITQKENLSPGEYVSLAISKMTKAAPGQLSGQLYAARASALRRAVMPKGLIVEDGFLKQFLCTNGFTEPLNQNRIRRAPEAAHLFEAYLKVTDVLPNQKRQAMGHTIFTYLKDFLNQQADEGLSAEAVLRERSNSDPDWFRKEIQRRVHFG